MHVTAAFFDSASTREDMHSGILLASAIQVLKTLTWIPLACELRRGASQLPLRAPPQVYQSFLCRSFLIVSGAVEALNQRTMLKVEILYEAKDGSATRSAVVARVFIPLYPVAYRCCLCPPMPRDPRAGP